MKIKGNSVRSIKKLVALADGIEKIRLVHDVSEEKLKVWERLGFNEVLEIGDTLMPSCIGKFTEFNANGKEIVRRDLPKENRIISYYGTWTDWHGDTHSGIKTRNVNAYPKEYIEAPSENLSVYKLNNRLHIVTEETTISDENEERNLHLMNLMLECFGEFEVFDIKSESFVGNTVKKIQWDILPEGEYPWSKSKEIVKERIKNLDDSDKKVIEYRVEAISKHNPDFLAVGRGGFTGYFVYGFKKSNVFLFESTRLNNATYIFKKNWEELSKLTKNQIINSEDNICYERIIHDKKWKSKIDRIIEVSATGCTLSHEPYISA